MILETGIQIKSLVSGKDDPFHGIGEEIKAFLAFLKYDFFQTLIVWEFRCCHDMGMSNNDEVVTNVGEEFWKQIAPSSVEVGFNFE